MSISSIVLVGLSGNTREFLELVETRFAVKAILSDSPGHGPEFRNIPVAPLNTAREFTDSAFLFLIGSEKSYAIRKKLIADLGVPESRYATLVHPRATVSKEAVLGFGTVLSAGVTVTANARLGNHVMILPNSVIHHDVDVGRLLDHRIERDHRGRRQDRPELLCRQRKFDPQWCTYRRRGADRHGGQCRL